MNSENHPTPFDLSTVNEIVVLPLGFGRAAPKWRFARFNGHPPQPGAFSTTGALQWQSAAETLDQLPNGRARQSIATFLQYGMHVSGRHTRASVAVLGPDGFEAAAAAATQLLAADGRRAGGSGVAEWSPAFVTVDGLTTLGLHVVCLDDDTQRELDRVFKEQSGLRARVSFDRLCLTLDERNIEGRTVQYWWNTLCLAGTEDRHAPGIAGPSQVIRLDHNATLWDRINVVRRAAP